LRLRLVYANILPYTSLLLARAKEGRQSRPLPTQWQKEGRQSRPLPTQWQKEGRQSRPLPTQWQKEICHE
jgi:hypothetical protein